MRYRIFCRKCARHFTHVNRHKKRAQIERHKEGDTHTQQMRGRGHDDDNVYIIHRCKRCVCVRLTNAAFSRGEDIFSIAAFLGSSLEEFSVRKTRSFGFPRHLVDRVDKICKEFGIGKTTSHRCKQQEREPRSSAQHSLNSKNWHCVCSKQTCFGSAAFPFSLKPIGIRKGERERSSLVICSAFSPADVIGVN